jgi:heat shock protein HslJ
MKCSLFCTASLLGFLSFSHCEKEDNPVTDTDVILGHWDIEVGGTLFFEEDTFSASSGCNSLFGDVEIENNKLSFSWLASTLMACPGPEGEREEELKAVLENAILTFSLKGNQMELFDPQDNKVMTLTRPENAALVNQWSVLSIRVANGITSSIYDEDTGITFLADGGVQLKTACNSGAGNYSTNDIGLQIQELALTEMACKEERRNREQELVNALSQINGYSILRNTLSLEKDGESYISLGLEE